MVIKEHKFLQREKKQRYTEIKKVDMCSKDYRNLKSKLNLVTLDGDVQSFYWIAIIRNILIKIF